jgi:NAD(P)H dehydrogenase (quinone)
MIVVTAASGQPGRLTVDELKNRVAPDEVVAAARYPRKVEDLGVQPRLADYDKPGRATEPIAEYVKALAVQSDQQGAECPED